MLSISYKHLKKDGANDGGIGFHHKNGLMFLWKTLKLPFWKKFFLNKTKTGRFNLYTPHSRARQGGEQA